MLRDVALKALKFTQSWQPSHTQWPRWDAEITSVGHVVKSHITGSSNINRNLSSEFWGVFLSPSLSLITNNGKLPPLPKKDTLCNTYVTTLQTKMETNVDLHDKLFLLEAKKTHKQLSRDQRKENISGFGSIQDKRSGGEERAEKGK